MRDLHCSICGNIIAFIGNNFGIGEVICTLNCTEFILTHPDFRLKEEV